MTSMDYPKKIILSYSIFISTLFMLLSCYAGKRTAAKEMVLSGKKHTASEAVLLEETNKLKEKKLDEEKIDTSVNNKIQNKLNNYEKLLDSANVAIAQIEQLLSKKNTFRKNYKNVIIPLSVFLNNYNNNSSRRLYRYTMIKDGLSIADKKLYELAAFFGPGRYIIPDEKKEVAYLLFSPLVDSIKGFSNKYSDIQQTASLIINGFADATGVSPGSNLYNILATALNKTSPEKAELNMQLSQFRANAIANCLDTLIQMKSHEFKSWSTFKINSYEYGQGETLPTKTITDYTENDERRRVVLIYWCVLPEDN